MELCQLTAKIKEHRFPLVVVLSFGKLLYDESKPYSLTWLSPFTP